MTVAKLTMDYGQEGRMGVQGERGGQKKSEGSKVDIQSDKGERQVDQ